MGILPYYIFVESGISQTQRRKQTKIFRPHVAGDRLEATFFPKGDTFFEASVTVRVEFTAAAELRYESEPNNVLCETANTVDLPTTRAGHPTLASRERAF
jgi:hypothetical protein